MTALQLVQSIPGGIKDLHTLGDNTLLNTKCVAIIGTREPSPLGEVTAFRIAAHFATQGYTIVSGLCHGIDVAGHRGALSVGGKTIAVLACPLDYSQIHKVHQGNSNLAKDIVSQGGLLLTEYTTPAYDWHRYLERDRLQSGLSIAVIPVQGSVKTVRDGSLSYGGTYHTCQHAIAQKRLLLLPRPSISDEEKYPEKYAMLHALGLESGIFFDKSIYRTIEEGIERHYQALMGRITGKEDEYQEPEF